MAFSNGYSYRRTVTVDHTKVSGSSDISNFSMYFKLVDTTLKSVSNGGHVQNGTYLDIRLESIGGSHLSHEIIRYNASTGSVEGWVLIPTLTYSSDSTFYVYYGNASLAGSEQNPSAVWPNWDGVIHMADGMASSKGTSFGDGDVGANAIRSNDSPTGAGYSFNNTSTSYINLGNYARWTTRPSSFSFWVYPTGGANYRTVFSTGHTSPNYSGMTVRWWNTNIIQTQTGNNTGSGPGNRNSFTTTNAYPDNSWYLVHVDFHAHNDVLIYVNGVFQAGAYSGTATTIAYQATEYTRIGQSYGTADQLMSGEIAELRVRNAALPLTADGMVTEYNNQSSPSTFYSLGSEQSAQTISGTGIASTAAFGSATVTNRGISAIGIASTAVTGGAVVAPGPVNIATIGVPSTSAIGNPSLSYKIGATAIASTLTLGSATIMRSPWVVLDAPVDGGTLAVDSENLTFVGTDGDGDAVSYEVQINTSSTFITSQNTGSVYTVAFSGPAGSAPGEFTFAQLFHGAEGLLKSVSFFLSNTEVSSSTTIVIKLYATSAGVPTGSPLATSSGVVATDIPAGDSIGNPVAWISFDFSSSGFILDSATTYALVPIGVGASPGGNINAGAISGGSGYDEYAYYNDVNPGAWATATAEGDPGGYMCYQIDVGLTVDASSGTDTNFTDLGAA